MSIHNDAQVRLVFIDISKKYKYKLSTFITGKNYPDYSTHYSINFSDAYLVIVNVDREDHIYHVFDHKTIVHVLM